MENVFAYLGRCVYFPACVCTTHILLLSVTCKVFLNPTAHKNMAELHEYWQPAKLSPSIKAQSSCSFQSFSYSFSF